MKYYCLIKAVIMKKLSLLILLLACLGPGRPVMAQGSPDSLYNDFASRFKKSYLSFGALLQVVGDYQNTRIFSGSNGFNISNMRLSLSGEFDKGIGYFFNTNFINSPAILDAKIYIQLKKSFRLNAGLFKSPFSGEYLTPAADIDFVNRSRVVSSLAPKRQTGVMVSGWNSGRKIYYALGMFNGNGFNGNMNDNNNLLYAGRLAFNPLNSAGTGRKLEFGINAAASRDDDVNIGGGFIPDFKGWRELGGADFRAVFNRLLISGEIISARFSPDTGGKSKPSGYHISGGYMITGDTQILMRYDSFRADNEEQDSNLFIIGYNYWPSRISGVQVNYIIPEGHSSFGNHQVLVNLQISL